MFAGRDVDNEGPTGPCPYVLTFQGQSKSTVLHVVCRTDVATGIKVVDFAKTLQQSFQTRLSTGGIFRNPLD